MVVRWGWWCGAELSLAVWSVVWVAKYCILINEYICVSGALLAFIFSSSFFPFCTEFEREREREIERE